MGRILYYICIPLGVLMKWCFQLVGDYGWAIILFTVATRIVLLPFTVWTHRNTISMVRIQPAVNFLKAAHYGDPDRFAEEQAKLFKKEKYHPLLTLVPLALQMILLLGVVEIIYHPLQHLFSVSSGTVSALAKGLGLDPSASSVQLRIIEAVREGRLTAASAIPGAPAGELSRVVGEVQNFRLVFLGMNLSVTPADVWGAYTWVPAAAGLSALVLCVTQNLSNVLQHEQGKLNQYALTLLSVGIALYLGIGVPTGIALYWIAANLFSVAQMYILNAVINPRKHVDYEALERSRRALADIENLDRDSRKSPERRENRKRERRDYRRFFSVVNKHLVFYSEKSGFYKYYEALIGEILRRSNLTVHYVTNDPNDAVFRLAETEPRIRPYYIGLKKTIPLMMRLETDIAVMTTPDLDKLYLKRSLMRKDIEYIYAPHDMCSVHMGFREGALDAFDTILCTGPHVEREVRATERAYNLPEKRLVRFGYPLAERLIEAGLRERETHAPSGRSQILIAPSWQEDNLLDSCLDALIDQLYGDEYRLIVRPHPEYVKRYPARMESIEDRFADRVGDGLVFETDFSVNRSVYTSDLLVTDWSAIAFEFCFATKRPALFVNTKMKCLNPNWEKIGCVPVEVSLRDEVGVSVDKEELGRTAEIVRRLLADGPSYEQAISDALDRLLFHEGRPGETGASYILSSLLQRQNARKRQGAPR